MENGFSSLRGVGGRVTNKVRLKEDDRFDESGMYIDTFEGGRISFKDSLLDSFRNVEGENNGTFDDDIELREDVVKENDRGLPSKFSSDCII